jgi:hypothetical protein
MQLYLLLPLFSLLSTTRAQTSNTSYLTAPALVTVNNRTIVQCWRLTTPFLTSSTPGTNGAKAATISNATNLGSCSCTRPKARSICIHVSLSLYRAASKV